MQSHLNAPTSAQHPQPASPRQGLMAPRGERAAEESARSASVALEPHWAAAIDAATD